MITEKWVFRKNVPSHKGTYVDIAEIIVPITGTNGTETQTERSHHWHTNGTGGKVTSFFEL